MRDRRDDTLKVPDEPWVTLVLSGGVFRGVFQIGVLAALHQASIRPRLFAGASVGSIMAAMAARLFTAENGTLALQRLAATFLSLDRLVVTDRFTDFVRRFMVRANDVRISPKNLDQFLRRFDLQVAGEYNENARTVLAGIARLLFISPSSRSISFELSMTNGTEKRRNCSAGTLPTSSTDMEQVWNFWARNHSGC